MVSVGRDLKGHLSQSFCHGEGHFPLDQVAHSPIQPVPKQFQAWAIPRFSGQPVPVTYHPHSKAFIPNILISPLSLKIFFFVVYLHALVKRCPTSFL